MDNINKEKLEKLKNDAGFIEKFKNAKSNDEIKKVLSDYGIDIDMCNINKLDEKELQNISGGRVCINLCATGGIEMGF